MKYFYFSKAVVPNAFTALNAVCGFLSIVFAGQHDFKTSAILIFAAALFDLLDGIIARLLNTSSEFGVQLDSLSDVISFGAAPAFLIYESYMVQFGIWGVIVSSFLLICGAFRLARYNIQVEDLKNKKDFKGLPIPINAVSIAALVITFHQNGSFIKPYAYFLIPFILILAVLMVSRIRYDSFTKISKSKIKARLIILIFLIAAIVLVFITDGSALFFIFISYILIGIFRSIYKMIFPGKNTEQLSINEKTN